MDKGGNILGSSIPGLLTRLNRADIGSTAGRVGSPNGTSCPVGPANPLVVLGEVFEELVELLTASVVVTSTEFRKDGPENMNQKSSALKCTTTQTHLNLYFLSQAVTSARAGGPGLVQSACPPEKSSSRYYKVLVDTQSIQRDWRTSWMSMAMFRRGSTSLKTHSALAVPYQFSVHEWPPVHPFPGARINWLAPTERIPLIAAWLLAKTRSEGYNWLRMC